MKTRFLQVGLICTALYFGALPATALDAVVIVNESVPVSGLTAEALKNIYTGKTMYWEGGQNTVIVVMPEKTDAALKEVSGMDSSQFRTFWQRLAFSGRGQPPKKGDDAAALVALVASTKGSIALVPVGAELKGVKKIEIK